MAVVTAWLQPGARTVAGLDLILATAVPLVLASQAQMIVMALGDLDLGIGPFVGLVTVVVATVMGESTGRGLLYILALVLGYAAMAAVIQLRRVPSLLATLAAGFVWGGIALILNPTPGGRPPDWLFAVGSWRLGWIPVPIVQILVATAIVYGISRTRLLMTIRALGSNSTAVGRSGHSPLIVRVSAYVLAGIVAIAAGFLLTAQIGSGDSSSASTYTLMTIAAVILGGGTFFGGTTVPWGTAIGALTLGLVGVVISVLDLSTNLQAAAQGGILVIVLAGRALTERLLR